MLWSRLVALSSVLMVSAAVGCGGDDEPAGAPSGSSSGETASSSSSGGASSSSGQSGSTSSSGGSSGASEPTCEVTFLWWQKDAYKETGGRTTEVWPPHTTTQLLVACPGRDGAEPHQGNHGSEPAQLDADGRPLLDEVRRETATVPVSQADALLAAYNDCVCEPTTTFLSMDSLDQSLVPELLEEFIGFVEDSGMSCGVGGVDTQSFLTALREQHFEAALILAPTCRWPGGNAERGLNEALREVLARTSNTLADYHVCNNDAKLQATLFWTLKNEGRVARCDRSQPVCQSPLWFYSPDDE